MAKATTKKMIMIMTTATMTKVVTFPLSVSEVGSSDGLKNVLLTVGLNVWIRTLAMLADVDGKMLLLVDIFKEAETEFRLPVVTAMAVDEETDSLLGVIVDIRLDTSLVSVVITAGVED